jgi:hypothetical protein
MFRFFILAGRKAIDLKYARGGDLWVTLQDNQHWKAQCIHGHALNSLVNSGLGDFPVVKEPVEDGDAAVLRVGEKQEDHRFGKFVQTSVDEALESRAMERLIWN